MERKGGVDGGQKGGRGGNWKREGGKTYSGTILQIDQDLTFNNVQFTSVKLTSKMNHHSR